MYRHVFVTSGKDDAPVVDKMVLFNEARLGAFPGGVG